MAKLFCSFFFVLLIFSVASIVPGSDAVKKCQVAWNSYGCELGICNQWCSQQYKNGVGACSTSGFGSHTCLCVYDC
uniref:Defensin-like protein 1 n=1 Tax=Nelumbo nucifera TaxID=4432 RepID=A0A822ZKG3_NELNU|nr:TPA_asm: hypothetical protein HUJ06_003597 [Nelumbo nucifera]